MSFNFGFSRSSTPEDTLNSRRRVGSDAQPISPAEMQAALSDVTYASQYVQIVYLNPKILRFLNVNSLNIVLETYRTSLEDAGGFSRDAFGRQSMSEKRHATLDAKNTDTYQRNKKLRDERDKQKHGEGDSDKTRAQRLAEERNLQGTL